MKNNNSNRKTNVIGAKADKIAGCLFNIKQ